MIDLLNSISQLPDVTDEDGNAITPEWKSAGVYWRDLPELAMMFREYGIGKSSICGVAQSLSVRSSTGNLFHEQTSSPKTKTTRKANGMTRP